MIVAVINDPGFPDMIKANFNAIDIDESNDLDISEFEKVIIQIYETGPPAVQNLSGRVTPEYVSTEFKKTDSDNSGKISPDEFVEFLKKIFVQVLDEAIAECVH